MKRVGGPSGSGQSGGDRAVGRPSRPSRRQLGVEVNPFDVRDPGEIERDVTTFARDPNGGLIVPVSAVRFGTAI